MAVVIAGRQFWLWRAVVPYRFGNNGQEQLERLRGGWRSVPCSFANSIVGRTGKPDRAPI
jgi:hypothetical protein